MPCQQLLDGWQRRSVVVHDIEPRAAVNVKINITRRHHAIAEVGHRNSGGKLAAAAGRNFEDASFVDEHERALDGAGRSQQLSSSKSQHRNVLIAAIRGYDQDCSRTRGRGISAGSRPHRAAHRRKSPTAECYTV